MKRHALRGWMGLLLLMWLTGPAMAIDNPWHLLTAAQLPTFYQQTLPAFWHQHAQPSEFLAADGVPLRYVALRNPASHDAVIVVNGRLESYIKYQELARDLYQQGYSVYLYDHRGKGFSGRMLSDPQKGYVGRFDDYVDDLQRFHESIVRADQPEHTFVLAHSMGGAIAARYLARQPAGITAAVLSAPMFGIELGALPEWLARALCWLMETVTQLLGIESPYAPSQGTYQAVPFAQNELTHDALRYAWFRDIYRAYPEVQLGGPTAHWITQALDGASAATLDGRRITTPVLVLQAGDDSVVRNDRQATFCRLMSDAGHPCAGGQPLQIAGARHELFNEQDDARQMALNAAFDFFKQKREVSYEK